MRKTGDGVRDDWVSVRDRCAGWSRTGDDGSRRKGGRVMKNIVTFIYKHQAFQLALRVTLQCV